MSVQFGENDWNTYAQYYDTLVTIKPYRELHQAMCNLLPQHCGRLLDIGCGTGTLLQHIQGAETVVGIDRSREMLNRAKQKHGANVQLHQTALEDYTTTKPDLFDCIVSCNVLYTFADPQFFAATVAALLQPGGTYVIATPKAGYDNGLILKAHCQDDRPDSFWTNPHTSPQREKMLLKEAFGDTQVADDLIALATINRTIQATQHFHFFSAHELQRLLEHAGLQVTGIELAYAEQAYIIHGEKPHA